MLSMPPATMISWRAGQQHVVREHGGLHAGAAHLGQRDGAGALGQAALERGLARRGLALAGHQAVAEQHFADGVAGDAGALDGRLDGGAAEVVRGQGGEVALEAAHGGAGGADDDDGFSHGVTPCGIKQGLGMGPRSSSAMRRM
jgi:hypothetical protein